MLIILCAGEECVHLQQSLHCVNLLFQLLSLVENYCIRCRISSSGVAIVPDLYCQKLSFVGKYTHPPCIYLGLQKLQHLQTFKSRFFSLNMAFVRFVLKNTCYTGFLFANSRLVGLLKNANVLNHFVYFAFTLLCYIFLNEFLQSSQLSHQCFFVCQLNCYHILYYVSVLGTDRRLVRLLRNAIVLSHFVYLVLIFYYLFF